MEGYTHITALCDKAGSEKSARAELISIIEGNGQKLHGHGADHVFKNLDPLADELPKPQSDHC